MEWKKDRLRATQPFFVLDTEDFQQEIYQMQGISHFYQFKIKEKKSLTVVPDACFDIVFEYCKGKMKAYACGTVVMHMDTIWEEGAELFGVRFLPGYHPAGFTRTMREMLGKQQEITADLWDTSMLGVMEKQTDFYQRIRYFLQEYTKIEHKQLRPFGKMELVMSVKDLVYDSNGQVRISELADKTGYSERYINKVFIEQMGFSPKAFCKIIQFQRALEYLNYGSPQKMTEAAVALGYYDQPQFIRDFEKYCGITPSRYLRMVEAQKYRDRVNGIA